MAPIGVSSVWKSTVLSQTHPLLPSEFLFLPFLPKHGNFTGEETKVLAAKYQSRPYMSIFYTKSLGNFEKLFSGVIFWPVSSFHVQTDYGFIMQPCENANTNHFRMTYTYPIQYRPPRQWTALYDDSRPLCPLDCSFLFHFFPSTCVRVCALTNIYMEMNTADDEPTTWLRSSLRATEVTFTPWQEMWWAINLPCIYMRTHAHTLWITVMYSALGHIWHRLHISVRLKKAWSPWVNQYSTRLHLFHERPSISFSESSSVKQMLMKWNLLGSVLQTAIKLLWKKKEILAIDHLICEKCKSKPYIIIIL